MKCLNQLIRPSKGFYFPNLGFGDCATCMEGPDNKNCLNFQPYDIKIRTFLVFDPDLTAEEEASKRTA